MLLQEDQSNRLQYSQPIKLYLISKNDLKTMSIQLSSFTVVLVIFIILFHILYTLSTCISGSYFYFIYCIPCLHVYQGPIFIYILYTLSTCISGSYFYLYIVYPVYMYISILFLFIYCIPCLHVYQGPMVPLWLNLIIWWQKLNHIACGTIGSEYTYGQSCV